jgi:RsiW-degrading membrane proteinase PrsW (M82 family)
VKPLRIALFLAATLAIWTLGNFALRAVWVVAGLPTSTVTTQVLNVVMLAIAVAVAWLILKRVPEGDGSRQSDKPESKSP